MALLWGRAVPVAAVLLPVTFGLHVDFSTALPNTAGSIGTGVAVGDFNGDGKPDFVITNGTQSGGNASVLLNTTATGAATSTFACFVQFATPVNVQGVAVGDFNGDGKLDFAIANRNGA